MTGSWLIKKNGVIIPSQKAIEPKTDPEYWLGWPQNDHYEGIEIPQKVYDLIGSCIEGDVIEIVCELRE